MKKDTIKKNKFLDLDNMNINLILAFSPKGLLFNLIIKLKIGREKMDLLLGLMTI